MSYGWRTTETGVVELCDECGFDARDVVDQTAGLHAAIADLQRLSMLPHAERRPEPDTYSAREYAEHGREVTMAILGYVAQVTGRPLARDAASVGECANVLDDVLEELAPQERDLTLSDVYPSDVSVDWLLAHLHHDLEHHVLDVRRGLARIAMSDLPVVFTVER